MVAYIEVLKALVLVLCGQRIKEPQRRLCIRNFRGKTFWAKFYLLSPSPPRHLPGPRDNKTAPHSCYCDETSSPPTTTNSTSSPPSPTIFPLRQTKCWAVETPYPRVNPIQSKVPPGKTTGCPKKVFLKAKWPQCMIDVCKQAGCTYFQPACNHLSIMQWGLLAFREVLILGHPVCMYMSSRWKVWKWLIYHKFNKICPFQFSLNWPVIIEYDSKFLNKIFLSG